MGHNENAAAFRQASATLALTRMDLLGKRVEVTVSWHTVKPVVGQVVRINVNKSKLTGFSLSIKPDDPEAARCGQLGGVSLQDVEVLD